MPKISIKNSLSSCSIVIVCLAFLIGTTQQVTAAISQTAQSDSSNYPDAISTGDSSVDNMPTSAAQELPDTYYRAQVIQIVQTGTTQFDGKNQDWQTLQLQILNGDEKDKKITLDNGKNYVVGMFEKYAVGDKLVIAKPPSEPGGLKNVYYIYDRYRSHDLAILTLIFFGLAVYFGRKRGLTSIIGMLFSVVIIFYFIIPHILKGGNPFLTCLAGAIVIILLSLYFSHGFNRRTTIALLSSFLTLGLAVVIDLLFVHVAQLVGIGTEEAFYLQFDNFKINLQGVLLGGILIGVLGVLDDVTTGQAAAIEEIFTANNTLTFRQLYDSGLSVGKEHIASLINTLVLAYVGASFPLLLLYSSQKLQPLWVTLNNNFIAEEIVRTLVGSTVLVIAVPLTTLLSAYFYSQRGIKTKSADASSLVQNKLTNKEEILEKFWGKKTK